MLLHPLHRERSPQRRHPRHPEVARVGGYAAAALLLVSLSITPWVQLLFPLWVLLLSIEILRRSWTSTGTVGRDAGGG